MKRDKILIFSAGLLIAGAAHSQQLLQYEKGGGTTNSSSTPRVQDAGRQLYLDGELDNLPSDMSHAKWARERLPLFQSMDTDGDTVLSEYDLRDVDIQDAMAWARETVEEVMSFWRPQVEAHIQELKLAMSERAGDHYLLKIAAEDAGKDIGNVLKQLGFLNADMGAVYVTAKAGDDVRKVKEGLVSAQGRKWVELVVPLTLLVSRDGVDEQYEMFAHVIGMLAFPRYEGDDRMVLWNMSVSWDEEAE